MTYEVWEAQVPLTFKEDSLWRMRVYRLALYLADVSWEDVTKLSRDRRVVSLADQLYRAVGSVSANIAEGYSRGTGKDRARFFEYALGSARESRDWYYKSRHVLGDSMVVERINLLSNIIRLLLVIVPSERSRTVREDQAAYDAPE